MALVVPKSLSGLGEVNENTIIGENAWTVSKKMPVKVDREKTWNWLGKGDLKTQTEAMLCAAQEQATRTSYIKHHIDKSSGNPLCRMCGKRGETVLHTVSECEKLAQKEYNRRHDNVARRVHWELCKKNALEHKGGWYENEPEGAVENENVKLLWDMTVQCDNIIEARRPYIVFVDKKESCMVAGIAVCMKRN